jgi:hypothetical protein
MGARLLLRIGGQELYFSTLLRDSVVALDCHGSKRVPAAPGSDSQRDVVTGIQQDENASQSGERYHDVPFQHLLLRFRQRGRRTVIRTFAVKDRVGGCRTL